MARMKGPKKTNRYPDDFKIKAVQLFADPGAVDVDAVALAAADDLRVAGHHAYARVVSRRLDGVEYPAQQLEGEPLFDDQAERQPAGTGPGHGEIVDGTVHGEMPDVAAGEFQRLDDKAVGRKHDVAVQRRQ